MDYYTVSLDIAQDISQTIPFTAGNKGFLLTLKWSSDWSELKTYAEQNVTSLQKSSPLYDPTTQEIIKEYDIGQYVKDVLGADSIHQYIRDGGKIPYKFIQHDPLIQASDLYLFVEKAISALDTLQKYQDSDVWSFVLSDDAGQEYTGLLRKGGWITAVDGSWEIQFRFNPEQLAFSANTLELQVGIQ